MRILLTAINAKYIHSNLAVYSLKASAGKYEPQVELAEFTINHQAEAVFSGICRRKPQLLLFSCYIWNRREVLETAANIKKVYPDTIIWAGGPEVSWDTELFMQENPQFDGVMIGEGERTFYRLLQYYVDGIGTLEEIDGIAWRESARREIQRESADRRENNSLAGCGLREESEKGRSKSRSGIYRNCAAAPQATLDDLPFVYRDLGKFENRIIYYESSRGCPFSCSYCMSSLEKRVRFRNMELVKKELAFFLENKVLQVKFVDRTFNCNHAHAMEIWRFLLEHDNGVTNFHFEISADILTEEEIELIRRLRPGLAQFEIGVQTVNEETLEAIHRHAPFEKIVKNVRRIAETHNIHQHLDLIAGLPYEDYESFGYSFDAVYGLYPQELQLGFLKVLRGSEMHRRAEEYGIIYRAEPPYEVLETRWISCEELLRLKEIEEMLEVYYNSRQFDCTVRELEKEYGRPFLLYEALAGFYREEDGSRSYTRLQRLERLREFAHETVKRKLYREKSREEEAEKYAGGDGKWSQNPEQDRREQEFARYDRLLILDLYLRENAKSRPAWAEDQALWKDRMIRFYKEEEQNRSYLPDYAGRTWKQLMKMTHLERIEGDRWLLFDYAKRDPLTYAASVQEVSLEE
ncbi:MAG: DUF4080 domain-containing protein [Lachnospiraceae bacterium]|nr:DUF4080 domain-containing protein [Lachnospiraceae bacterium]